MRLPFYCLMLLSCLTGYSSGQQSLGVFGVTSGDGVGLHVTRVVSGGPADKAGIKAGDTITLIGNKQVPQMAEESELMSAKPAGSSVQLGYLRGGVRRKATLVLTDDTWEKVGISAVRDLRDDHLTDPDSLRLTSVRFVSYPMEHSAEAVAVCIEGHSKNKMGGYARLIASAIGMLGMSSNAIVVFVGDPSNSGDVAGYRVSCFYALQGTDVTEAAKAALKADREKDE